MAKIEQRYDPVVRESREPRNDRIRPPKNTQVIEKMYEDFIEGIKKLEKDIAKGKTDEELAATRKRLGEKAWSLRTLYGYEIKDAKLQALGIVLKVGKVIPRGQSGGR